MIPEWELHLRVRQIEGTATLDDRSLNVLHRLADCDEIAHRILIRYLLSFPTLDVRRRLWALAHAEQRPIWDYDIAVPIRDQLPVWMVRELRGDDDATRWVL